MKRILVFMALITAASVLYSEVRPELVIYTMPGCGRCAYTVRYLKNNNINYTEYSTSDQGSRGKMWQLVRGSGKYKSGSIRMPVVLINGEVFFNIPDLQKFAGSISEKLAAGNSGAEDNSSELETEEPFVKSILERHNYHRKNHDAPALKWNPEIAKYARQWAEKIASENRMYHRQPNRYGENIYWRSGGDVDGASVTDSWYSEIKYYNFSRPGFSMSTGHFTQVVWAGSSEIGCGKARSRSGGLFVVCNYNPPGNYLRMFDRNVKPKQNN